MIAGFLLSGRFVAAIPLIILMGAAFILGLIVAARINGLKNGWQLKSERISVEHRFLCPSCLNFGPFDYACQECKGRVEPFLVHTDGAYVAKCAHCHRALFTDQDTEGRSVVARCSRCEAVCNRKIYHNRVVRTIATLTSKDFIALTETTGIEMRRSEDNIRFAIRDDGRFLTIVLNLGDLADVIAPDSMSHALRDISRIWIDSADTDPLALGQTVDAMIMKAKLPEMQWRSIEVCSHQAIIDPASRHVLETRFGHLVSGVSITEFTGERRPRLKATSGDHMTAARY